MNIEHLARHVKVHHLHRLEQPLSHLRHEYHMYGVPLPSQASMHATHNYPDALVPLEKKGYSPVQAYDHDRPSQCTLVTIWTLVTGQDIGPRSSIGPWSLVPSHKTLHTGPLVQDLEHWSQDIVCHSLVHSEHDHIGIIS